MLVFLNEHQVLFSGRPLNTAIQVDVDTVVIDRIGLTFLLIDTTVYGIKICLSI
jgi:hypothetical protein